MPAGPSSAGASPPLIEAGSWPALAQPLPLLAAVGLFVYWGSAGGGYFPHDWYAGGILFGAMILVALVGRPDLIAGLSRPTLVAVVALAGFAGWSFLSIGWADVQGDSWLGAGRTALYLLVFTLFAVWRVPLNGALILLGAFALGVGLLGAGTLAAAARADDASAYFIGGRFVEPLGYVNGNAALAVLAFWPAFFLASRRELPILVRALFLAIAGVLLELALLPQSRGALLAFPVAAIAYVVLVPNRVRTAVHALPVAVALAVSLRALLDVADEDTGAGLASASSTAAKAVAASALGLFVCGLVLAVADRRLEFSARTRRVSAQALAVLAVTITLVALVTILVSVDVGERARTAWEQLNTPPQTLAGEEGRLTAGLQSSRGDLWRVALAEFREHPLTGIGTENFAVPYVADRRAEEETLYPHSFPIGVLTQTGLVGAALMAAFLVAAIVAGLTAVRRLGGLARAVAGVCLVVFVSWLAHASIDWFWELPALTAPAIAFLALAGASGGSPPRAPSRRARLGVWISVALVFALVVSFIPPWLSARETRYAATEWRRDYAGAIARLDRARRLNPLSDAPDLTAGSIAQRREDWGGMAAAYERALERNPFSWYSRLELALARAKQGRRADAAAELDRARELNPREPLLDLVGGWLVRGQPVNVAEVAEVLLNRHASVTGNER